MRLICETVTYEDLSQAEKILIACRGESFCFIYYNSVLKINKTLPKTGVLARIAAELWQYEQLIDDEICEEMGLLWKKVRTIAGSEAADQLWREWSEATRKALEAEDRRAAAEWLCGRDIAAELDIISETTGSYRPGLIKALWSQTRSADALFLYAYQVGMEDARKAVLV